MLRYGLQALLLLSFANAAFAQGEAAEDEGPWSGAASLGYLSTAGNTDTKSYNLKFAIDYAQDSWEHGLRGSANGADEGQQATAEAYQLGWKSKYNFTEHDYLFGTADWRKDRFSGVDQQLTEALGYGRRLIDTPSHMLNAEIGVGHRSADLSDGTSESGAIGRGAIDYTWTLTETSAFEQDVVVESGADNTYIESVSALRAKLLGDFAMVLSYTIKHNTDVPIGNENTDRLTAVSIEYAF